MANVISSMVSAQMTPASTSQSGQFVKLDSARVAGQSLPNTGNDLPEQPGNPSIKDTDLKEAVDQINTVVQTVRRDLAFSVDEASGRTIIKVVDSDTGKLVRQIPNEEVLALASHLRDIQESADAVDSLPSGMLFSDRT